MSYELERVNGQLLLYNKWLKNSDMSNQRHFFSDTRVCWSLADRLTGWAQKLVLLGCLGASLGPGLLLQAPGNGVMSAKGKSYHTNTRQPCWPACHSWADRCREGPGRTFQDVPECSRLLWAPGQKPKPGEKTAVGEGVA